MTNIDAISPDDLFADLQDDREAAAPYLSIFIDEAQQSIDELIGALLALEAGGGRDDVKQLFIAAHRIKGSAASIGLNRPAKLAHLMEDLLQNLVDRGHRPTPQITDALLACTDGLRQYVSALGHGSGEADRFNDFAQQLISARSDGGPAPAPAAESPAAATEERPAASTASATSNRKKPEGIGEKLQERVAALVPEQDHDNVLIGQIQFEPNFALASLKTQLIASKLSNLGNICYFDPPLAEVDTLEEITVVHFGVVTDKTPDAVQRLLQVAGVQQLTVEPLERRRSSDRRKEDRRAEERRGGATESTAKPVETMRVDIDRLDELMNLAGQLAMGKARVAQVGARLKKALAENNLAQLRDGVGDLFESMRMLDRVSDGIQQGVMNMRMLPIGPLFGRFHRVIRDLNRANGKDIRLAISGESTELDKRMIDELGDPMIHLIRNAADHGIESPADRTAAGKPGQGTISLSAFHRGSSIIIRVADDGRGLDAERIRAKAVEKGLLSAEEAERKTPQQLYQLIWLPGLSTAEKVTEVSGRGVGMDIVRSKIDELNGAVEVESKPGQGTVFTIKLPLTLAILPCLMVEVDGEVFAVPLESVIEVVHVGRHDISTVQGHPLARLRDRVVSILRLGRVFHWRHGRKQAESDESDSTTMVIIGEEKQQIGLAVSEVLGEEDVVIKSIADNYRNVSGIAGASILGDGRVSLILDPPTLIEMSYHPHLAKSVTLETMS
jgi:two-component system, chemotaxis family, sensor kinase CheA